MLSFKGHGMHQHIISEYYQIYPKYMRDEVILLDEEYLIIERLQMADKLPTYEIPDFPLSCEMLSELKKTP